MKILRFISITVLTILLGFLVGFSPPDIQAKTTMRRAPQTVHVVFTPRTEFQTSAAARKTPVKYRSRHDKPFRGMRAAVRQNKSKIIGQIRPEPEIVLRS